MCWWETCPRYGLGLLRGESAPDLEGPELWKSLGEGHTAYPEAYRAGMYLWSFHFPPVDGGLMRRWKVDPHGVLERDKAYARAVERHRERIARGEAVPFARETALLVMEEAARRDEGARKILRILVETGFVQSKTAFQAG
ncbi:hypothetical protein Theos_2264 (plasmid) [Thermus oshimai JL-2]|uniref:Uncharacterized protein n=1 Tax=Thermus oshimai JL-2 TaxID=751945 RepID=K7R887_THEOS|nr:hypothetical protein [Thermus oshimai]AFV77254.1 hypothetical protein Theos_2264 [Thermus oshimai JL-2]